MLKFFGYFAVLITVFCLCGNASAQEGSLQIDCPKFVQGYTQPVVFTASYIHPEQGEAKYVWTVAGGEILSGQGTPVLTVMPKEGKRSVKAMLTLTFSTGQDEFTSTAYCSVSVTEPQQIAESNYGTWLSQNGYNNLIRKAINFAIERYNEGNYQYALDTLFRVLSDRKKVIVIINEEVTNKEVSENVDVLNTIGAIYDNIGSQEKALEFYQKALSGCQKEKNLKCQSVVLSNMAGAYSRLGQYRRAGQLFEKSMAAGRAVTDFYTIANTLNYYGFALQQQEKYDAALAKYQSALALVDKIKPADADRVKRLRANIIDELGRNALARGQLEEATNYFEQALAVHRASGNLFGQGESLSALMTVWYKRGQPMPAVMYGKQAINIYQATRNNLQKLERDVQTNFIRSKERIYHELAEILIALGRLAEAEEVLAMLKEKEYFDYLRREDQVASELKTKIELSEAEKEAFERFEKNAGQITAIGREYYLLERESKNFPPGKFPKQAQLRALGQQLSDARRVFYKFLADLDEKFKNRATGESDLRVAQVSGTKSILDSLNQPRTVIISTIAGADRLNLIVTTSKVQRAHVVQGVTPEDLNRLVWEFRQAVMNPEVDPRPAGKKLYEVLFPAALQKDLEGVEADTIVWSLDGALRYAPLAALSPDGKTYLVEKYANVLISLASRDKLRLEPTARKSWTVLGGGVSKAATVTDAAGQPRKFSDLAAVPQELCSIVADPDKKDFCAGLVQNKTGALKGLNLVDEEFTLEQLELNLERHRIVHIASHFSLNPGNYKNSFLLLGGKDKLTLEDVRLQLDTKFKDVELLTLSACNTAMSGGGIQSNGVEVESFGALAQDLGARSVLATLWAVADPSTRDLMSEFYRQLAPADLQTDKSTALQRAQLALLRGEYTAAESLEKRSEIFSVNGSNAQLPPFKTDTRAQYAHPFYWSPFILFGNWR